MDKKNLNKDMGKITKTEAKEHFIKQNRSKRGKTLDMLNTKSEKYVLNENDERGSYYLKEPNGTKRYDFKGVDDSTLKTKKEQDIIIKIAKGILEKGKKNPKTKEIIRDFVEYIRMRVRVNKNRKRNGMPILKGDYRKYKRNKEEEQERKEAESEIKIGDTILQTKGWMGAGILEDEKTGYYVAGEVKEINKRFYWILRRQVDIVDNQGWEKIYRIGLIMNPFAKVNWLKIPVKQAQKIIMKNKGTEQEEGFWKGN
jgi:hypothetical protein